MLKEQKSNIEKDKRVAKRMIQYLLFYGAFIFVLSFTSYFLDLIFYSISYGFTPGYSPFQYVSFYMIYGYFIFPLSLLYNYFVNRILPINKYARIIAGVFFCLMLGFLLNIRYHFGEYIGEHRPLKNFIVLTCSGVLLELLRTWIVQKREKEKISDRESFL
jgi:hypothetical protein